MGQLYLPRGLDGMDQTYNSTRDVLFWTSRKLKGKKIPNHNIPGFGSLCFVGQ